MNVKEINTQLLVLWKLGVDLDKCVMCMSDKEKIDVEILETDFGRIPVIHSGKLDEGEFAFLRKGDIASE